MRYFILLLWITLSVLQANNSDIIKNKHIEKQIKKEKQYAKEQQFYQGKNYNLKDAEVDMNSVKNLPDVPDYNEDFDMDHVYD